MKNGLKTLSLLLSGLSKSTGYSFNWMFVNSSNASKVEMTQLHHRNPFCRRIKGAPCWKSKQCVEWYFDKLFHQALVIRKPFEVCCHAGARELAIPLFQDRELLGVLCAGPFRSSCGATFPESEKAYAALPRITSEHLAGLGEFLTTLISEIGSLEGKSWNRPLIEPILGADERFHRAIIYMRPRVVNRLSAKQVAAASGLSVSTLLHKFKIQTGYTFSDYLLRCRVLEARKLVIGSSMPLGEVAEHCALISSSRMAQLFRRYFGTTPKHLRVERPSF